MHVLANVIVPFDTKNASIRPAVARDAAVWARLDTLMFRYQQPEGQLWGVKPASGFMFDWWALGGRWNGWGRQIRTLVSRQGLIPSTRPIPRFLAHNAVWSEDLGRVRLTSALLPHAIVTPHGEWEECAELSFGTPTLRERKALGTWRRRLRRLVRAYPDCLAVAVDYHC